MRNITKTPRIKMSKATKFVTQSLFDVVGKIERSNATVSELRVPIFSPLEKISHNSKIALNFLKNKGTRTVATSWGESSMRGRVLLCQVHRDLLDCIYLNATNYEQTDHGSMKIFFSRRRVLISYFGNTTGSNNQAWLATKLEEIRDTTISFKNKDGDSFDFNIIKHLDYKADKKMYCIELDERYVKFYAKDLSVNYQKLLPSILTIKNSIIKTIVRFLLTHHRIKINLEKTLFTIGYPFEDLSDVNKRSLLRELKKESEYLKERFLINYDEFNRTFEYVQHDQISFISSITNLSKTISSNLEVEDLIGKTITRQWFEKGIKTCAKIESIQFHPHQENYTLKLYFPDSQNILELDSPFNSLFEIEKIID